MPAAMEPEEEIWKESVPCIVGIDEAGRGPVLGPMVYTAAYCPKVSVKPLKALGADDSKQLSEEQRNSLRKKIDGAPFLRYKTRILSAQELSENMLRKEKYNLNLISHDTAFELVQQILDDGINVTEIYVDTVGRPESYSAKFHDQFPQVGKIVVAKKADATYRIVGAASIVAKTTRDRNLREWHFPEEERSAGYAEGQANASVSFQDARGSGYPGDPLTKAWMEKNCDPVFGFPTLVRFSWGTTRLLMEKEAVKVDWYGSHILP